MNTWDVNPRVEDMLRRQDERGWTVCGLCGCKHVVDKNGELLERCPEPKPVKPRVS